VDGEIVITVVYENIIFGSPGTYVVTLEATDASGRNHTTKSFNVIVYSSGGGGGGGIGGGGFSVLPN
jgi:hypothetical protein